MNKIIKLTTSLLLVLIMVVASIINVNAAESTISIGTARKVNKNGAESDAYESQYRKR